MYRQCTLNVPAICTQVAAKTVTEVQLEGRGVLEFECDWGVGIGGGLWSTGILLTQHLCKHAALYDSVFRGKRVLELGSGTGLVGEASASVYSTAVYCIYTAVYSAFSFLCSQTSPKIRSCVRIAWYTGTTAAVQQSRGRGTP